MFLYRNRGASKNPLELQDQYARITARGAILARDLSLDGSLNRSGERQLMR